MRSEQMSLSSINASHPHVYCLLEDIFESCITEADSTELINNLSDLYDSFSGQGFESSFEQILLYVFTESKRSNEVMKILRFVSESVVSLDNKYKTAAQKSGATEDIDDIVHPLLQRLYKILYRWSEASNYFIRSRSCQLLLIILTFIQDHGKGEINMETYDKIASLIECRRLDVSSLVRTHAVLLAKFFQDPSTVNDPVIAGLCWQMQYDSNPRVRQNIVSIIAACEETIMPIATRFLNDKNAGVRNAALVHISQRIGPRSFTPSQRVLIIQQCFTDPSDSIRRNAEQKLIPMWFRACNDKLCNFFKLLRIGNDSLDCLPYIKQLTKLLSRFVKVAQIIEELELDPESYLPRTPLSGEKVFIWRHFFMCSFTDERLTKFFPSLDDLIPFILKCFDDTSSAEVDGCVFAELTLFLKDIMEKKGIQKCDNVFPMALNMMRHPFVSHELMPYLVALYLNYSPKEKDHVHNDIVEVIEDLYKLMLITQGHETNILVKCFVIASQVLIEEDFLTTGIKNIKDSLIMNHLSSEDPIIKIHAISALALYCLLDIKEAKMSWSLFESAVHLDSGPVRNALLEGAFDILKCHGPKIFADLTDDGRLKLEEISQSIISCLEDGEAEQKIILKGSLKLYLERHISSPIILSNLILQFYQLNNSDSILEQFFYVFSKTKDGYNCLITTFLTIIDDLFDASKSSPIYKINIKTVALQLFEVSKTFENENTYSVDKFPDLLTLKLTKKFLKKPWRLTASDLYSVCSQNIPENFETLLELKEQTKQIVESLQSSIFQQKNPFAKRNIKNFCSYLKKIQDALSTAPLIETSLKEKRSSVFKKLEFSSSSSIVDDNSIKEIDSQIDSSPSRSESSSKELDSSAFGDEIPEKSHQNPSIVIKTPSSTYKKASIDSAPKLRSVRKTHAPEMSSSKVLDTSAFEDEIPENSHQNSSIGVKTPSTYKKASIDSAPRLRSARKTPAPEMSSSKVLDTSAFEDEISEKSHQNSSIGVKTPSTYKNVSIDSAPRLRSTRKTPAHTVLEQQTPSKTPTTRKIATASRNRSLRKTPARAVVTEDSPTVFKTPAPRETPFRKRQLDISVTKTQ